MTGADSAALAAADEKAKAATVTGARHMPLTKVLRTPIGPGQTTHVMLHDSSRVQLPWTHDRTVGGPVCRDVLDNKCASNMPM